MSQTPPPLPGSMDEVELIEESVRCFRNGLIGLIPILGVPFLIAAMRGQSKIRRRAGAQWNPACGYLRGSNAAVTIGVLNTLLFVIGVGLVVFEDCLP